MGSKCWAVNKTTICSDSFWFCVWLAYPENVFVLRVPSVLTARVKFWPVATLDLVSPDPTATPAQSTPPVRHTTPLPRLTRSRLRRTQDGPSSRWRMPRDSLEQLESNHSAAEAMPSLQTSQSSQSHIQLK